MTPVERFTAWIVDDSALEAEAVRRALAGSCDAEVFRDGPSVLERISMAPLPDVVVLDWMLPGSSGLEVCRFLRQNWDEAELPILILTARGTKPDVVEGLSAGANDYVAKPYATAELAARVSVLVRLRRTHLRALRAEAEVRQHEQEFRRLAENLPDVVARFDPQHRHLYVSPSITRISALSPERFLGKTNAELGMPAQQVAQWRAAIDAALQGREVSVRFEFPAEDGLRHFHSRVVPERDEQGRVESVLCIARDVTAQVRAEQAMRESEERLRLTIEAGEVGTWDAHLHTQALNFDARAKRFFGLSPDRPMSVEHFFAALHPEDRERIRSDVEVAVKGGFEGVFQPEFRTVGLEDGLERWVAAQGRVIFDVQGKAVRFLGTLRDISNLKRQEEETRRMQEFEQKLVGIVGHDLRNPLGAIQVSAALLERRLSEPALVRKAQVISAAAGRAGNIISDLLDLTKARLGGGIPVHPQSCDLHEVIREVVEEHSAAHPARQIRLGLNDAAQGTWDRERLAQVVANLLSNALNYSPPETSVEVATEKAEEELLVRIHNEGPPIPEALRARLFEPFKRSLEGQVRREGLGLGLYIAERIVTAHGGHIDVASSAQHGTTFSVHLPWRARESLERQ
ncbi:PAS domain S-box protein [Hyalangium rubrum]|uniref:histidine kinase n=1 Tax=Hyalangium rubrum TaxID=3103134 RepID=A0ABU5H6K7_9BACT|nr:PAS domain S-box protein [Hyalangium sp. s54d21]MDY7228478.1 PAS domain S-box protein [Hyalangium sp. s54d21]